MSDLINRRAAIDAICNEQCELDVLHYPECCQVKYCNEIQALLSLPSSEKTGKWIINKATDNVYCSECGWHTFDYVGFPDKSGMMHPEDMPNYCSHCGARMVIEDE